MGTRVGKGSMKIFRCQRKPDPPWAVYAEPFGDADMELIEEGDFCFFIGQSATSPISWSQVLTKYGLRDIYRFRNWWVEAK